MNAAKTFFVVAFVVALLVLSLYVVAASTKPLIPNRYGNLLITSDPSGPSGVYLCAYKQFQNGISIGYEFLSTPVYLRSLGELGIPNGTYSLYIQKPGFKIYEQQVSISGNKFTKVHAKLEALEAGEMQGDVCPGVMGFVTRFSYRYSQGFV